MKEVFIAKFYNHDGSLKFTCQHRSTYQEALQDMKDKENKMQASVPDSHFAYMKIEKIILPEG